MAFLEVKAKTPEWGEQGPLPLPQRLEYNAADHLQALELAAEGARRAIQAAIGQSPLPTQAQRRNEKSGVALKQIEETAQRGSFHFIDHYEDALRQTGVILDDLIPHFYDATREIAVREEDDKSALVNINDPNDAESVQVGDGEHDVTISTGPTFDSEREQASDFADNLVGSQAFPQIAQLVGPKQAAKILALTIRLKNLGPIGNQIADTIDPPQQGQDLSPEAMKQQLDEAMQLIQMLSQELEAKTKLVETDQVKAQSDFEKERMRQEAETARQQAEIASQEEMAALKLLVDLDKAELASKSKMDAQVAQEHAETTRTMLGQEHEHTENESARMAEADEAERGRAFESSEAEAARQAESIEAERTRQDAAQQAELARQADADAAALGDSE